MKPHMDLAPDLSIPDREALEVAGMTPRQIDDVVSVLRVREPKGFTVQDVLDYVARLNSL